MMYENIFKNSYNQHNFDALVRDIFGGNYEPFVNPEVLVGYDSKLAKTALRLGKCITQEGAQIAVYEVEMRQNVDLARNRVAIRNLLKKDWQNEDGAFIASYQPGNPEWRFSFVCETMEINEENVYAKRITNPKRYTYLLGGENRHRTAVERFTCLKNSPKSLQDIIAAFSVEALTKDFYRQLYDWYAWAIAPETGVTFPNKTNTQDDDRENIETKIIRLITRLIFVWFIKQKNLVPDWVFDQKQLKNLLRDFSPNSTNAGNYYNAVLQNLFFATLNREIRDPDGNLGRVFAKRSRGRDLKNLYRYAEMYTIPEEEIIRLFSDVPFLNGGLFECLDKTKTIDGVECDYNHDGFSRNDATFADGRYKFRATVPNVLFFDAEKGLYAILNAYNFTVEENTPTDHVVALDPELLGKVFENLLGEYNPETRESARKQSGSFYTPREIVNYMVDESLIAYLGDTEKVRALFSDDFILKEKHWQLYQNIAGNLKSIKILDPACGSGAFPMGILNRIVEILKKIETDKTTYDLKLNLIQNCIYGVDMQPIAVQISKLRFFISLICECEKDDTRPNFGIPTLPNLETQFICANSLIGLKKKEKEYQPMLGENAIVDMRDELFGIRYKYFGAKTLTEKQRLRKEDEETRSMLANVLEKYEYDRPEDAQQIAAWDPYDQHLVSDFFDPEWMFGVDKGFDIVLGNPPYVQLQSNQGKLGDLYKKASFETFAKTGDIYQLFYEKGYHFLRNGGHLCFITSNKWMRAGYGESTRKFLAEKTNPKLLIDFAGTKIFENATVDTNILLFEKGNNDYKTTACVTKKLTRTALNNLRQFIHDEKTVAQFKTSESWTILSPIEQSIKAKIEAVGTPLKDWDIQINYGIKTGCNDAFIISTERREEILANCKTAKEREQTAEIIRPILRGRDIKRYGYEWAELWLINTHNGVKGKIPRINVEDYPAIKAHLDQHWKKISTRTDKGDTPYNLRNCAYLGDFFKPKIVWKRVGSILRFSYDKEGVFCLDSTCFAIGSDIDYLTGVLNSKFGNYLFKDSPKTGTGDLLISVQAVEPIIVPQYTDTPLQNEIVNLVKQRLKGVNTELDEQINRKVYELYGLSDDEIAYIEST